MNKIVNVKITNELKNPTMPGIHHRLLCMTGPDKGKVYYLTGKRIILGRGETADIQIMDVKVSREHAELSYSENGYTITDLGAHNGITVNNNRIKQKKMADAEKIVIGQTVFKYNIIEIVKSELILIDGENEADKNLENTITSKDKKNDKRKNASLEKSKNNPKALAIGSIVLLVLYLLMGGEDPPKIIKKRRQDIKNDFDVPKVVSKKISLDDIESKKKLGGYIHSGRREFSEGNYFRAMEDFRLALLLSPNDGHASFYLAKAKQRLDEEIEKNFLKGKQEHEAKKLQAAVVAYCSVVQLIQGYPNDQRYKNAMMQISAIESELGVEKGEIKCFEEKSANSKN